MGGLGEMKCFQELLAFDAFHTVCFGDWECVLFGDRASVFPRTREHSPTLEVPLQNGICRRMPSASSPWLSTDFQLWSFQRKLRV
jgi:hypothetical protein